ncbi:hypothetical protein [Algibacter pacificus]|uniref:hypothetical protein n=1 Tax=Algibacter pacificus TaxID=2599389 RepID=UPI0011C73C63|nr:hypothetical protein [Algibacter pacificus]
MIEYENTLIRKYENFIREIVNSSVNRIDWDKLESQQKMFVDKMKELFKFQDSYSWSFLTSSLDTLGDSHFAIVSFLNSNIENGKNFNTGERYLRLYGVLSSVYIHFRAISTLADLIKAKTSKLEQEFKSLDISFLRNAISAHPVNFDLNGDKMNFKIARYSLNDSGSLDVINKQNQFKTYDLHKSLDAYIDFSERTLEMIIKKMIQNRYDSSAHKREELISKLEKIKA